MDWYARADIIAAIIYIDRSIYMQMSVSSSNSSNWYPIDQELRKLYNVLTYKAEEIVNRYDVDFQYCGRIRHNHDKISSEKYDFKIQSIYNNLQKRSLSSFKIFNSTCYIFILNIITFCTAHLVTISFYIISRHITVQISAKARSIKRLDSTATLIYDPSNYYFHVVARTLFKMSSNAQISGRSPNYFNYTLRS